MTRFGHHWIVSRSEQEKAFLAEVPELPGCTASGETREGRLYA